MEFDAWFTAHWRWLVRLATALAGPDDAQDVVQEVALKARRHWPKIAAAHNPSAYVRRMVVNEHLSWRRRWGRTVPRDTLTDTLTDVDSGAPDHADRSADRAMLAAEIRQLPPRQRAVVVLRYLEGLGDEAIAEALGCGQSTVRSYATRALTTLRAQLNETTSDSSEPNGRQESSHAH